MPDKVADHRILNFASIFEPGVIDQAKQAASLPFVHPHVALMPDAHQGIGSAVGTVIPTVGAIIPAAVGVDIGCGMIAVETHYSMADLQNAPALRELREILTAAIPMSMGNYNVDLDRYPGTRGRIEELQKLAEDTGVNLGHSQSWPVQLGSLGGGNHFIELCVDDTPRAGVWMFLHSGSRGVGNKIARYHIGVAQKIMERFLVADWLPHRDLSYLPQSVPEFGAYMRDLRWAQKFALYNREEMMDRFAIELATFMGDRVSIDPNLKQPHEMRRINCHHNYTTRETHYGQDMWITRKGAIRAGEGDWGLIPGSMGARSFVVQGKGNQGSFCSAPHGAGRMMSRKEANRRFTAEDLDLRMRALNIEYRPGPEWVDEIPDAYKDISQVILDSRDLIEVKYQLRQVLNLKGT